MLRRFFVVLTSGLVTTAALGTTAPLAEATELSTSVVHNDGAGDVWKNGPRGEKVSFPPADVTRVVVRHATYSVRVRMRFVDLRRLGVQDYLVRINTSAGGDFVADIRSEPGILRQGTEFFDGRTNGCLGMTHRISYATNVVRMRIPRSCLGRPRWVRAGISNGLVPDADFNSDEFYVDNPHNHEAVNLAATRRLYRG